MPPKKGSKKASKKQSKGPQGDQDAGGDDSLEQEVTTQPQVETNPPEKKEAEKSKPQQEAPKKPEDAKKSEPKPVSAAKEEKPSLVKNGSQHTSEETKVEKIASESKNEQPQTLTPAGNSEALTPEEKLKLRQMRFQTGALMTTSSVQQVAEEEEKKKKDRLKRFGGVDPDEEVEKKKQRAARFGIAVPPTQA